ncbi:MAG: UDP-N-acetylmuramate dehydrogenase [Microscillaceae bacterium]|nr:UDP-N-acetylmuramate dehydrogenase [Microscillaceae bacterium]MDW8461157.1 UDP-N-acetylmuramate dehydrogenase [Cytophagales bacterium]
MQIFENHSLLHYNTFHVDASARYLIEVETEAELLAVLHQFQKEKKLILGGGSNILFTQDFEGVVIKVNITGIKIIRENSNFIEVEVSAGENWHQFVLWAVQQGYGGIENLALIPGNVGASVIQNIGAYGVEVKETVEYVKAIRMVDFQNITLNHSDCKFGYRDSIFKHELKNQLVITKVGFRLSKQPKLNTSYADVQKWLLEKNITEPTLQTIVEAVMEIRQAKLPNPSELGNAGSFFKNPIISCTHFERWAKNYQKVPHFQVDTNFVKVPAGWLIEQCGWKGKQIGCVGVYPKQALVLTNLGNAQGKEIYEVAQQIQASVSKKFDIWLETEVNVL